MEKEVEKEDLSNSREVEAMKKAFGIPAIVKLILDHFSRAELLQSRLVDTLWRDLSSDILNQRFTRCIYRPLNLAYDEKSKNYKLYVIDSKLLPVHHHDDESSEEEGEKNQNNNNDTEKDKEEEKNEKDLTALTELITNSDRFPCFSFAFFGGYLRNPEVQNFLNTHGKQIRFLYLIKMSVLTEKDEKKQEEQSRTFTKLLMRPFLQMWGHNHGESDSDNGSDDSKEDMIDTCWTCDMSLFRDLLWSQVPNLENFSVDPCGDFPVQAKLFQDNNNNNNNKDDDDHAAADDDKAQNPKMTMLPRLQTIALISHMPPYWTEVFKEIIMAAPNLQGLNDSMKLVGLSWFKSVNRLHLVRNVRLLIHPMQRHINGLTQVADFDLKLKRLELHEVSLLPAFSFDKAAVVVQNLEKILESSKETLEVLSVDRPSALQIIPGAFKWPEGGLKKLKLLRLANYSKKEQNRKEEQQLEYDLNLSNIFPNLTSVVIDGKSGKIFSSMMNKSTAVLDKVTRLDIINGSQTRDFMEEMVHVFPNVQILTMTNISRLIAFGSSLWKFKGLTTLALKLGMDGRSMKDRNQNKEANTNHFPNLDVVFTGFSKETVEKFVKEQEGWINLDKDEFDVLRVNPSILDCKQLRKLDIQFDDVVDNFFHHRLTSPPTFNLLSKVSGFFGFNLMPNLNVTLSIKKNRYVKGNSAVNDWKDEDSSDDSDDDDDEDLPDEQLSAESDFEYDPVDLDVEPAHKFSHDLCLKNFEQALTPMTGFPNVRVVSFEKHDISIFPDE